VTGHDIERGVVLVNIIFMLFLFIRMHYNGEISGDGASGFIKEIHADLTIISNDF